MDEIKMLKKIEVVDPVMIAGWPGMGSVALGAVDYLRRKLAATKFAELALDPQVTIDSVVVEHGLAKIPQAPKNIFYYTRKPDLILCEGEAQLSGAGGVKLVEKVLDLAAQFKVKRIYTGAAYPMAVSYKDEPEVYGAANKRDILPSLSKLRVKPMEGGHISGLNGLILGFAKERGIDAACLLATMPQYAISLPNPKATRAIIELLQKLAHFKVNLDEMGEYVKDMDEKMALIEDKVKDVFTIEKDEPEKPSTDKEVPSYIMDKIEKLFNEAGLDRSKAITLKKELDRWDLYKLYEDRFLDLFKENQ